MPMIYEPSPFELVIFEGNRGVLIPDELSEGDRKLSFVKISNLGNAKKEEKNKAKPASYFKSAKPIESEDQEPGFMTAVNAILEALS